ncbi:MAG: hypothetical protein IPL41_13285 [Micropruina sp.]|nr:hypothetical protein [Micropruina sp.]
MSPRDAEDGRFEELMSREFPDGLVPTERARPRLDAPAEPAPPQPKPPVPEAGAEADRQPAEGFRSWTPPDPPDEPFAPPPAPPAQRWSSAGIAGTVLVVLPLVLVLVAAFGVRLPMLVSALAGVGFAIGVVLLLNRLRHRPPTDGDGAVV